MDTKQTILEETIMYFPLKCMSRALEFARTEGVSVGWSALAENEQIKTPLKFSTRKHGQYLKFHFETLKFSFTNNQHICRIEQASETSFSDEGQTVVESSDPVKVICSNSKNADDGTGISQQPSSSGVVLPLRETSLSVEEIDGNTLSESDLSYGCPFSVDTAGSQTPTSKAVEMIIDEMSEGESLLKNEPIKRTLRQKCKTEKKIQDENTDTDSSIKMSTRRVTRRKERNRRPMSKLSKETTFIDGRRKEFSTSENESLGLTSPSTASIPSVEVVEITSPTGSDRYSLRGRKLDQKIMSAEKGIDVADDSELKLNRSCSSTKSLAEFTDDTEVYSCSDRENDPTFLPTRRELTDHFSSASVAGNTNHEIQHDNSTGESLNEKLKDKHCKFCKYKTCEYFRLHAHVKKCHSESVSYIEELEALKVAHCDDCNLDFPDDRKLKRHIEVYNHMNDGLSCKKCNQSFKSETILNTHFKSAHKKAKDRCALCEYCSASYLSVGNLRQHMESVHTDKKSFTCESCEKSFFNKSQLRRHQRVHGLHESKRLHCEQCDKTFLYRHNLQRHIELVHTPQLSEQFHCSYCGKGYSQKASMINHVQIVHFNLFPYTCKECKANFTKSNFLLDHMLTVHKQTGVKIEDSSRNRIYGKTDEEKFYCAFCNEGFLHKIRLIEHVHTDHSKMFPFICEQCNQGFISGSFLDLHSLKVHGILVRDNGEVPLSAIGTGDILQILSTKSGYPARIAFSGTEQETADVELKGDMIVDANGNTVEVVEPDRLVDDSLVTAANPGSTLLVEVAGEDSTLQYIIETPYGQAQDSDTVAQNIANLLLATGHTAHEEMEINSSVEETMTEPTQNPQTSGSESINVPAIMETNQVQTSAVSTAVINIPTTLVNVRTSLEQNIFSRMTQYATSSNMRIVSVPAVQTVSSTTDLSSENTALNKILNPSGMDVSSTDDQLAARDVTTLNVLPESSAPQLTVAMETINQGHLDLLELAAMETVEKELVDSTPEAKKKRKRLVYQ